MAVGVAEHEVLAGMGINPEQLPGPPSGPVPGQQLPGPPPMTAEVLKRLEKQKRKAEKAEKKAAKHAKKVIILSPCVT